MKAKRLISMWLMALVCAAGAQADSSEPVVIYHEPCDATLSARGFSIECWEDDNTKQIYSDEDLTTELTGAALAQAVTYAKLPENPVWWTDGFTKSESENDRSVQFNWAAVTTFEKAKTNLYETSRSAEFIVSNEGISNARLLWNRSLGNVCYGKYTVRIYVNGTEIFSIDQNDDKEVEGVFVIPLPGLAMGDVVKFEVKQNAKATVEEEDPSPVFMACLEYNIPETTIYANENPDELGAYYTTFYDGHIARTLSNGATAYTGTVSDDNLMLTPIEDDIIPKGEAVIIRSHSSSITLSPSNSTKERSYENSLMGSDTDTEAPDGCYILSYGQNRLGFYRYAEGKTLAAHKAFLIYHKPLEVKGLRMVFADDEADGMELMENGEQEMDNPVIYNLQGVRLNELQKGINIVNGQKFIVK